MSDQQDYKEYRKGLEAKQSGMSREEVEELLQKKSEYTLDLDNIKPTAHRWVDRGLVMSCEGGGHETHRAFKRR